MKRILNSPSRREGGDRGTRWGSKGFTYKLIAGAFCAFVAGPAFAAGENVVTSQNYVDTAVATKQNDIGRQDSANIVVTYPTTNGGATGTREITTSIADDNKLVTRGAVNTALNTKQPTITGTSGNVATYAASGLNTTGKAIYNASGTYSSAQQAALIEAGNVNTGIANGFNEHLTCHNPPDCTLWVINDLNTNTAYIPTSSGN